MTGQIALAVENMKAYQEINALSSQLRQAAGRFRTLLDINNAIRPFCFLFASR